MHIPTTHQAFLDAWADKKNQNSLIKAYQTGENSFIPNLLPAQAVRLSTQELFSILHGKLGKTLEIALKPEYNDPDRPAADLPNALQSPLAGHLDGSWLKQSNMIGINVRTIHTFWNIIKYMLTVPKMVDSVHLLPIWEPGVVSSLYGMASWRINDEFFSRELADFAPFFDTTEKQLRLVVNLLHAMGKTVGMDVIPHTDRFSEMALAQPHYFEWLRRRDTEIVDHQDTLHEAVQDAILAFLDEHGAAVAMDYPAEKAAFFGPEFGEANRLKVMFGMPDDRIGRTNRRTEMVKYLYAAGYEPVPATMAPPFRGMAVDPSDEAEIIDDHGMSWRDFQITKPESMSRVFNPLARFKFYGRLNDNQDWALDFDRPNVEVWDYVCQNYYDVQRRYGFDFMRGDMSHVQMRPDGVPDQIDRFYDILGTVKNYIREQGAAHFGYFAETFLPPRDIFGYGEEIDHLEASDADSTLGDLQSLVVGTPAFVQKLRQYHDLLVTRNCAPNFTIMTGDKDDPRFDEFYVTGNEVRQFIGYFLTDMPSYVGLGFETRDVHLKPVPNEHYTKLFVFHETKGSKARTGDYIWGVNGELFHHLTRLRIFAESIFGEIQNREIRWLIAPDATGANKVIAWTHTLDDPPYVFVANLNMDEDSSYFMLPPLHAGIQEMAFAFSTAETDIPDHDQRLISNGRNYRINNLLAGEGRVYRVLD